MKTLRTTFFWCHLTAGVAAGLVILVMSFTGVVLALKPQILNRIERDVRFVTPQDSPRLGAAEILEAAARFKPGAAPVSLAMQSDRETSAAVNLGRDGTVYVNPYTGDVLGTGSARANEFFASMTTWHRYLNATGEARATGKAITGAANLAFLFLGLSGLYIWWPRQLTARYLKPITWFRRASTSRARDFNWHNVIGFWCLPAIVVMTASGAVISYPWASNLVYRLAGSPVPERSVPAGEARTQASGAQRAAGAASGTNAERGPAAEAEAVIPAAVDQLWTRADRQVPTWSQLSMRLPAREGGPVQFTIVDGAQWNRFARSTLTLSSRDARIMQWQPYDESSAGQKARGWLRFAHTGELGGLTGQIVAGVGCAGGVMLVWTGLSLAIRRLWNWSVWSRLAAGRRNTIVTQPALD